MCIIARLQAHGLIEIKLENDRPPVGGGWRPPHWVRFRPLGSPIGVFDNLFLLSKNATIIPFFMKEREKAALRDQTKAPRRRRGRAPAAHSTGLPSSSSRGRGRKTFFRPSRPQVIENAHFGRGNPRKSKSIFLDGLGSGLVWLGLAWKSKSGRHKWHMLGVNLGRRLPQNGWYWKSQVSVMVSPPDFKNARISTGSVPSTTRSNWARQWPATLSGTASTS